MFAADLSTFLPAQCDAEKLGKKIFGENDVEAVLQRFDRLTQEEAKTTGAQTLEVAYRLVKSMKEVMDGAQAWIHFLHMLCLTYVWLGGKAQMNDIREALGTFEL